MSIKKLIKIVATCDGPCGTVLELNDNKLRLPDGWLLVKLEKAFPEKGESAVIMTSGLCPKCSDRFHKILRHEGYSFVLHEKKEEAA